MVYRVQIAGRVFEGTDPKALVRLAVQARKGDQLGTETNRPYQARNAPPSGSAVDCA